MLRVIQVRGCHARTSERDPSARVAVVGLAAYAVVAGVIALISID
jgi:hypothetical protein